VRLGTALRSVLRLGLGRVGMLAGAGLPWVVGSPHVMGLSRAAGPQRVVGVLRAVGVLSVAAQAVDSATADSIAAARPIARHLMGGFWAWVVPIGIFVVSAAATLALYRRFARERDELEAAARARDSA
jgi:hypothetical protein